ncbi:MAG: hypothetical protein OSA99_07330, partial [Acidimicrobiales bacterium]|nr:hypothetical protein [Acidimicrobiales bacterium]
QLREDQSRTNAQHNDVAGQPHGGVLQLVRRGRNDRRRARRNRAGGGIDDNADDGDDDPAAVPTTNTLTGVTLTGNDAGTAPGNGGGLHITGAGTVDVVGSTVDGNTATEGGGLWNFGTAVMTVVDSTISNNATTGTDEGDGGGGLFNNGGTLTTLNVTISGNTSATDGGAVKSNGGEVDLVHTTVTDNSTGVIDVSEDGDGALTIATSIVAGNEGDDCESDVTSDGYNVVGSTCDVDGTGDVTNVSDPGLGGLADNGGATLTHLPASSSAAVDAGTADCVTDADQRGADRPVDGDRDGTASCDAGSVEALSAAPATANASSPTFTG